MRPAYSTVPAGEFCGHCGAHLRTADVFVPLVILVVIGLLINQLGNMLEARLQAWRGV